MQFNLRKKPFDDVRVRKALQKAVNIDEINKTVFGGKGEVMYLDHFHPTRLGYNPNWEKRFPDAYGYDPEAAKKLLADAGYASGLTLEMIITDSEETTQHQLLQSQLKRVGIDVKFTVLPREQHRPRLYRGDFDLYRNSGAGLLPFLCQSL